MERLNLEFYYGQEAEQFSFYRMPKALIKDDRFKGISNNAKLLYGLMLDRMGLSARSGWFDEENRVYIKYSLKNIMEELNCSKMTAIGSLKELEEIGLVDVDKKNGLANIIYVKNFISETNKGEGESLDRSENYTSQENEPQEKEESEDYTGLEIEPVENSDQSKNYTGTGLEIRPEVVQNLDPNNKEYHTELINTKSITPSEPMDEMDEAEAYMQLIRDNLSYDIMMSDLKFADRETFDELYQLICDVVCVPRKCVKIGGEDYPYNLVKSRFLKLTAMHLQYVIECLNNNTTKVSNIRSYLITALYNAPNTINNYYRSEVNHDTVRFNQQREI